MVAISTLISRAARWYGAAIAVDDGRLVLTFSDVEERSNRLANAIAALCPEAGSRVAILSSNRSELVEIDFGVAKAGRVRVPINSRLGEAECRHVLADSGADLLIAEAKYCELAATWLREVDSLQTAIVLGTPGPSGLEYEEVLAAARPGAVPPEADPAAGSFILYTSGTTGQPKGALSTVEGKLAATFAMLRDELVVPIGGAMVHAASMAHGSGSKVLAYFLKGARNIPMSKWDPEQFLSIVSEERATGTFIVPTMLMALVEAARSTASDHSTLCSISYGGAPIAPNQLAAAIDTFSSALVQVYGSCEAPHPVLVLRGDDHVARHGIGDGVTSAGREALHCEVRLVGDDGGDVAWGQPGELWVKGPNVMAAYWGNPEATRSVFVDGWYRTGDVARRDDDGYFYIVDRARDVIITGGLNVYPAEVENLIRRHPAVANVAVVGVPNEQWGEDVKAFVIVKQGATVSDHQLIDYCRSELAGYKKPRFVEFVDKLPLGPNGKVLKRELRDQHWVGRERHV